MEKKETFRFGVMGAGNISNKFCDAAEKTEEVCVTGVTSKTQHNEVAPAQHELAPIYDTTNIATDHNHLIMEIMKKCFRKKSWMGSILVWLPECMCS